MDFVLDSDSDHSENSPVVQRTDQRPPLHQQAVAKSAAAAAGSPTPQRARRDVYDAIPKARKTVISASQRDPPAASRGSPYGVDRHMSRGELESAYRRLELPRAGTKAGSDRPAAALAGEGGTSHTRSGSGAAGNTRIGKSYPSFAPIARGASAAAVGDAMKLSNIVDDSDELSNGDDLMEPLPSIRTPVKVRAATAQVDLPSLPRAKSVFRAPAATATRALAADDDHAQQQLRRLGIEDAHDLLAEFSSNASSLHQTSTATQREGADRVQFDTLLLPRSNARAEPATQQKSIRDELDESKSRFRQSINELLISSPVNRLEANVSPRTTSRDAPEFDRLVAISSAMGDAFIKEETVLAQCVRDQRAIHAETISRAAEALASAEGITHSRGGVVEGSKPARLATFLYRALGALFMIAFVVLIDYAIQEASRRHASGEAILERVTLEEVQQAIADAIQWAADRMSSYNEKVVKAIF